MKSNIIRRNAISHDVTIDPDKIFEHPLAAEPWGKIPNTLNARCTHLCCYAARCASWGILCSQGLEARVSYFMHLNILCEECLLSIKHGHQQIKRKVYWFN